jgi:GNAT superfamily N-acetyltransferase
VTAEILELLGSVFPGLGPTAQRAIALGMRWELCSTPFVHREDGRIVAHVGVLELPLLLGGEPRRVAGIHGVCTDAAHRGRGLASRLLEEALTFVHARYTTALLTASEPALYERYGFRVVAEHCFTGPLDPVEAAAPARVLDRNAAADRALLDRLLRDRAPVSHRLGVTRERDLFLFKTARAPLLYAADLDAVFLVHAKGRTLIVEDVVAARVPPLADIAARTVADVDRVEVRFCPDLVGGGLVPAPWVPGGDELLMVRGPFAPGPLCLPRTARC